MVNWKRTIEFHPHPLDVEWFAHARGFRLPAEWRVGGVSPLVLITESAYVALWKHARSANVEIGGMLVGHVGQDEPTGRYVVQIVGVLPAEGGASSAVSFVFTPAAWDHITAERERRWPDLVTVGWYHTHPHLGVFYSGTDRATQRAFFNRPWNVGIVIDPFAAVRQVALFAGGQSESLDVTALIPIPDGITDAYEPFAAPAPVELVVAGTMPDEKRVTDVAIADLAVLASAEDALPLPEPVADLHEAWVTVGRDQEHPDETGEPIVVADGTARRRGKVLAWSGVALGAGFVVAVGGRLLWRRVKGRQG